MPKTLLTLAKSNTKLAKTSGLVEAAILHLAPHTLAGRRNICTHASTECIAACNNLSGRGAMPGVQAARIWRTQLLFDDREAFLKMLCADIELLRARALERDVLPVVRPNGTSDLLWERMPVEDCESIFDRFPDVMFWDYTKVPLRHRPNLPHNYHLSFSYTGLNDADAAEAQDLGANVVVVFDTPKGAPLPSTFMRRRVIDGDKSDLRYMDPSDVVVGLRAKGPARNSGKYPAFVQKAA
jgi:hypothetical protein